MRVQDAVSHDAAAVTRHAQGLQGHSPRRAGPDRLPLGAALLPRPRHDVSCRHHHQV